MVGLTLVDISQLQSLVKHPKWEWVDGIKCFPEFKPTQKVRLYCGKNELWLPDLQDTITLAYLHYLYAINSGRIRREGEMWVSSHGVEGKDFIQVLVVSFLQL